MLSMSMFVLTVTAQVDSKDDSALGTVRTDKEYIVHPEKIKQALRTGVVFYVSKVEQFGYDKVKVMLS